MSSPLHKEWPVELASKFLLPPIQKKQYLLIERAGFPVAYCSWAFLNKESFQVHAQSWMPFAQMDYLI